MADECWHGYIAISRFAANLSESNWVTLITEIRQVGTLNGSPPYKLAERGNLDTFDYGGETYSNIYIYEARFYERSMSFDKFAAKLVNIFEVDPEMVTYTEATTTIREHISCFATYKYNGVNRIRIGLFGCVDDSEGGLCIWAQSKAECNGYILDNIAEWDGVFE